MNRSALITAVVGIIVVISVVLGMQAYRDAPPQTGGTGAPPAPVAGGGCIVGGCSAQLCTEESEGPVASDCMYRPEYECYKTAKCERQSNGQCGWTPSASLTACLANPPQLK